MYTHAPTYTYAPHTQHEHQTHTHENTLSLCPAVAGLSGQVHPSRWPLGCKIYLLSSPSGPRKVTSRSDHLETFLTQSSKRFDSAWPDQYGKLPLGFCFLCCHFEGNWDV